MKHYPGSGISSCCSTEKKGSPGNSTERQRICVSVPGFAVAWKTRILPDTSQKLLMPLPSDSPNLPTPPAWMQWFIDDVARGVLHQQQLSPLGCHYIHNSDDDVWEVTLFVSRTEIAGGPHDGLCMVPFLQVDVSAVMAAFDEHPRVCWQSGAADDDDQLGNHLSIEGVVEGRMVWLRLMAESPREFGPGRRVHASTGVIEDLW